MHPTDHYTALGWALRDASNYICLCCLFWFGLRRTGWQSFIAGERYRDNRRGAPEPKWKWRPVMIIIDIVIVIINLDQIGVTIITNSVISVVDLIGIIVNTDKIKAEQQNWTTFRHNQSFIKFL